MSSSCFSTSPQEKLHSLIVAMEESKEKETRNTSLTQGSPHEVTTEGRVEIPSFGSGPVLRGSEIMKFYPAKPNKIYNCHFCKKGFSTPHALGGHQKAHRKDREWGKKRKEMEAGFPGLLNAYLDKPHILLGGYSTDALSNENHLGFTLKPFKRLDYPSFNSGVTGGISDMMNMAAFRRVTPTRFFTGNTSTNGSASKGSGPFPSNNSMYPLMPGNNFPSPPPPPRTSRDLVPQKNDLSEEDLVLKIGMNNVVEIDDDDVEDHPEEGTHKCWGTDLSLSL